MNRKLRPPKATTSEAPGFALITTLIMVTLAAVIVVALLSNATLDRATSKSVADRFQAEIAAKNGLEAAKKALAAAPNAAASATADDSFLVIRVDGTQTNAISGVKDAYYFIAKAKPRDPGTNLSTVVDCYPLFSGGVPTTTAIDTNGAMASPTPPSVFPIRPAQDTVGSKLYPPVLTQQQPAFTQWQEIKDPNDTASGARHDLPYQRYTFWVEDLAGYVDANVAGNTSGASSGNARPKDTSTLPKRYLTTASELPLFTLFDPTLAADSGTTGAKSLLDSRGILFTGPTLHQIAPGASQADVTTLALATHLQSDSEVPFVPFGFGYKDEGDPAKPKLDLNAQVTAGGDPAVTAIATKINDNLPIFATTRQGGLSGQDYSMTIAASMIDYADTDSDATVGPQYRGLDSYPLVSELFNMKWWNMAAYTGSNGDYFVQIQMDTWAELWNMTNQAITGTCFLDMLENLPIQTGISSYTFGITPSDVPSPSTVATTYPAGNPIPVTLSANQYGVYHVRKDVFQFDTGIAPPLLPPNTSRPMPLTGGSASNYTLKWSGASGTPTIAVDHAGTINGVGISRIGGTLNGYAESSKRWSGGYPGFGYTDVLNSTSSQYDLPGDPRSGYYIQSGQVAISYAAGSSFWERNNRANIAPTAIYQAVKPTAWSDGGHDSTIVTATPTPKATSDPPASAPAGVVTESTKAPVVISNAGSYSSLGELGNIYDPGQWNVTVDSNNQWTDITDPTQSSGKYGGGYQLRIGRPEFTLFDKPGTRSSQLLDLFTTGPRVNTSGLVNVNTASRDALRILGAAVLLNRDPEIQPPSLRDTLYPPAGSKQGDVFADAVIAARPFLSPSQLSSIKVAGTTTPFFGNSAAWSGSQAGPTEWADSARKEYFAKVLPLTTVRSRNFRIFITGQSLDKTGKVMSTVNKVFQVYLNPTRDGTGKITSQNVIASYETNL